MKKLNEFFQNEYVMSFLMGLNDSFSAVRSQVLLMDPIPAINKVFALITQEEKQRSVGNEHGNMEQTSTVAMAVKDDLQKKPYKKDKEKPTCAHCKIPGHTADKCYKLHGYPPGSMKPKSQVNCAEAKDQAVKHEDQDQLTTTQLYEQCNQLMAMLSSHMNTSKPSSSKLRCQSNYLCHRCFLLCQLL